MKLPRLTPETVFAKCDELMASGQNPTLALLLQEIGYGSFTTLSKYRALWRAQRKGETYEFLKTLPPSLSAPLRTMCDAAVAQATQEIEEEREALHKQLESFEQRHEEDEKRIQASESENQTLKRINDDLRSSYSALSSHLQVLNKTVSEMTASLVEQSKFNGSAIQALTEASTQGTGEIQRRLEACAESLNGLSSGIDKATVAAKEREDGNLKFMQSRMAEIRSDQAVINRKLSEHTEASEKILRSSIAQGAEERKQALDSVLTLINANAAAQSRAVEEGRASVSRTNEALAALIEQSKAQMCLAGMLVEKIDLLLEQAQAPQDTDKQNPPEGE